MKRLGADHVNKEEKEYECEPLDKLLLKQDKEKSYICKDKCRGNRLLPQNILNQFSLEHILVAGVG